MQGNDNRLVDVVDVRGRTVAVREDQVKNWRWFCPEPPMCEPGNPCSDSCGWLR